MRLLVINGSPKGSRSNTYRVTNAFIDGMKHACDLEIRQRSVRDLDIKPCLGCFACWNKTPGKCVISDDMTDVIADLLWADVTIWSFPLYYFSLPGGVKTLMDRQLPMSLPFMSAETESGGHPARYDMTSKRTVVISTCGFYTAQGNYEGVNAVFDHLCGKGNYTAIYCGQGELFRVKELSQRTDEYLSWVCKAGEEFVRGGITADTQNQLQQLLYPREVFEAMADASWGVDKKTGETEEESLVFTRQMAALYDPSSYPGKDLVLEMHYTEIGKQYQILLTSQGSQVLTTEFRPYTTRIETPYALWKAIACGEITGEEALMQGKYRVKGDFQLMIQWDRYFGGQKTDAPKPAQKTALTNMNNLLFPWILFWVAAPIHGFYGSIATILGCGIIPLLYARTRKTMYDLLSTVLVSGFACAMILGMNAGVVVPLAYLAFGVMWSLSCFFKIPLTAHYSMNDYNGEDALKNPLFVKTNRILTGCWGVLYLLTPVWTYWIMRTEAASWVGAVNSVLPILMGVFTAWFQKWYPARIARGE